MKFICNKADFIKGLNIVNRFAYSKYQQSILECIHIKAANNEIVMDAFDMTTAIKTRVSSIIEAEGETAIPARVMLEIVSKMPDGEIIFERQGNYINICGADSSANLSEMDAKQFPVFPEFKDEKNMITLKPEVIKEAIDKTAFSVYTGDDKPIFTGLLFESNGNGELNIVAIDGVRMARFIIEIPADTKVKAIVPSKMMKECVRIFDDEENIELYFSDNSCYMKNSNIDVFTRLVDGNYMDYRQLIPNSYKTRVIANVANIEKSLELMMVLAREDSSNVIHMSIENSSIEMRSVSRYGTAKDKIPVKMVGDSLVISYNAKYLLDVFKIIDDENVSIEFNGRMNSCVIKPVEGDRFLYLVVPINTSER